MTVRGRAPARVSAAVVAVSLALALAAGAVAPLDVQLLVGRDQALSAPWLALGAWCVGSVLAIVLGVVAALRPAARPWPRRLIGLALAMTVVVTGIRVTIAAVADAVSAAATGRSVTVLEAAGAPCALVAVEWSVERGESQSSAGRLYFARDGLVAVPVASWQADGTDHPFADRADSVRYRGDRLTLWLAPAGSHLIEPSPTVFRCG